MRAARHSHHGFSLIEVVIVIVILGVISAIAIPRMSRGAAGASETALASSLTILRRAVEHYAAEHEGRYPTNSSTIVDQLTMYTDIDGNTNATKTDVYKFGPYLRTVPDLPLGDNRGSDTFTDSGIVGGTSDGWFFDPDSGTIKANTKDANTDSNGVPYNNY